eukprot:4866507-Amphidinium_carterae.1
MESRNMQPRQGRLVEVVCYASTCSTSGAFTAQLGKAMFSRISCGGCLCRGAPLTIDVCERRRGHL